MSALELVTRYRTLLAKCDRGLGLDFDEIDTLSAIEAQLAPSLALGTSQTRLPRAETATASAIIASSPTVAGLGEDWHYGFGLWHECQSAVFNCTAGTRVSSPGAYGAYPVWDISNGYFEIVARQGALGTFRNGVAIERSVRSKVEQWATCQCRRGRCRTASF